MTGELVTVEMAAERTGKSTRTVWRHVQRLEDAGEAVIHHMPGLRHSLIDWGLVGPAVLSAKRGNPRHRESRNL